MTLRNSYIFLTGILLLCTSITSTGCKCEYLHCMREYVHPDRIKQPFHYIIEIKVQELCLIDEFIE
jgi:hypothetical protein